MPQNSKLDRLQKKIEGVKESETLTLVSLIRELKCLPDILGRTFEVFDKEGDLVYTVKQNPLDIVQINVLLADLEEIGRREEKELKKSKPGRR